MIELTIAIGLSAGVVAAHEIGYRLGSLTRSADQSFDRQVGLFGHHSCAGCVFDRLCIAKKMGEGRCTSDRPPSAPKGARAGAGCFRTVHKKDFAFLLRLQLCQLLQRERYMRVADHIHSRSRMYQFRDHRRRSRASHRA
jgi:hypothetical protein